MCGCSMTTNLSDYSKQSPGVYPLGAFSMIRARLTNVFLLELYSHFVTCPVTTFVSASTKKNSPHITDSSTPSPLAV